MGWNKIREQVRSAVESTQQYLRDHGISGERVPEEVQADRIRICENCPTSSFLKATRECGKCFCFMDVKTWLIFDPIKSVKNGKQERVECPAGHWPAFFEASNQIES